MDKDYIKSLELWIKGQKHIIQELETTRLNQIKVINLNTEGLRITEETLEHERGILEKQIKSLEDYIK